MEVARTAAESGNSWVEFTEEDGACDCIPSHEGCLGGLPTASWRLKYWGNGMRVGDILMTSWYSNKTRPRLIFFPPEMIKLTPGTWFATGRPHARPYCHPRQPPARQAAVAGQRTSAVRETSPSCCSISIPTSRQVMTLPAVSVPSLGIQDTLYS